MATIKKGTNYPDQRTTPPLVTPQNEGEESVSGHMSAPESDDSVVDNVHEVGLYTKASEENPQELGIGDEIDELEKQQ